jgi:hypothetical protein
MTVKDLPEESNMFKERLEFEETKDESDDPFDPAKIAEPTKPEDVLIHVEL